MRARSKALTCQRREGLVMLLSGRRLTKLTGDRDPPHLAWPALLLLAPGELGPIVGTIGNVGRTEAPRL